MVDMLDVYAGLVVTREYSSQDGRTVLLNWDRSTVCHLCLNKVDLKRNIFLENKILVIYR